MTNFQESTNPLSGQGRRKPGRPALRAHSDAGEERGDAGYEEHPQQDAPLAGRVFTATDRAKTQRRSGLSVGGIAIALSALCAVTILTVVAVHRSVGESASAPHTLVPAATGRRQHSLVRSRKRAAPRASAARPRKLIVRRPRAAHVGRSIERESSSLAPAPARQTQVPAAPVGPEEQTQGSPFSP
jgi:hypothetical protein